MKKKKTRRQQTIRCPYCGAIADLRPASEIYGDPNAEGVLFVCRNYPGCKSYVHVYPGTNRPLGPLANGDLRHLRIVAHRKFDLIWQKGVMSRQQAYRWMADFFCIPLREAHIGQFSEYRCQELIRKCDVVLQKNRIAS